MLMPTVPTAVGDTNNDHSNTHKLKVNPLNWQKHLKTSLLPYQILNNH